MEHDEIEGTGNVTAEKPQRATTPPAYFCEEWSTRSGIDVFQPGPSTAHITDEGRRVEQIDRTGVDAGGAR